LYPLSVLIHTIYTKQVSVNTCWLLTFTNQKLCHCCFKCVSISVILESTAMLLSVKQTSCSYDIMTENVHKTSLI
jgi:hypothetical protein